MSTRWATRTITMTSTDIVKVWAVLTCKATPCGIIKAFATMTQWTSSKRHRFSSKTNDVTFDFKCLKLCTLLYTFDQFSKKSQATYTKKIIVNIKRYWRSVLNLKPVFIIYVFINTCHFTDKVIDGGLQTSQHRYDVSKNTTPVQSRKPCNQVNRTSTASTGDCRQK